MISFIVIGRNEGERLRRCLESIHIVVREDAISDWELIYVDSQSTDNSLQIAKDLGAETFLITGQCNAAIARNIGAQEAKGNILFFIDGDMELQSGFIPKVVINDTLVYPFLSGIFDDVVYDKDWKYQYTTRRHSLNEGDKDNFSATTGGLFLSTKALWEQTGGMDNRFKRSQDYDLGLRLTRMGYPLCRKAILMAKHHMRAYEVREDYVGNVRYTALLLRKHWNNGYYLKLFLKSQYTTLLLLFSIFCCMWSGWMFVLYVTSLLYKTYKRKNRTVKMFFVLFLRDIYLLCSIVAYWPTTPEIKYTRI